MPALLLVSLVYGFAFAAPTTSVAPLPADVIPKADNYIRLQKAKCEARLTQADRTDCIDRKITYIENLRPKYANNARVLLIIDYLVNRLNADIRDSPIQSTPPIYQTSNSESSKPIPIPAAPPVTLTPTVSVFVSATFIVEGQDMEIGWSSTNASKCTPTGDFVDGNGVATSPS